MESNITASKRKPKSIEVANGNYYQKKVSRDLLNTTETGKLHRRTSKHTVFALKTQ